MELEEPVLETDPAIAHSPETERSKLDSVCVFCGEEEGAWLVGAYTLIMGVVGLILLVAAKVWDRDHVFGPIGIVLFVMLTVGAFLLFVGLYRRLIWLLYAWISIFAVNFICHAIVWTLCLKNLLLFLEDTSLLKHVPSDDQNTRDLFKYYVLGMTLGSVCLILSLWSIATIVRVRNRFHRNPEQRHLDRPLSFAVSASRTKRKNAAGGRKTLRLPFAPFRRSNSAPVPQSPPVTV